MSARDAPEWFGGESKTSHGGKSTNHTGRSSSSYNNQRRNPQPRRLSGGGGGGGGSGTTTPGKESDRRKKSSSHRRTKSREVINVPEVFDNKQQDTNFLTRIAPVENKTTNNPSRVKTRGEQKGRASVSKVTSEQGHDFRDGREKKTSLFEKLLGLTPARAYSRIKDDDRTRSQKRLLSKDNAVYDIVRSKSTGSADSDPTDSRNYRDTTSSNSHRRSYSDSIDISKLYASGEVLPPFSDAGPQGMKEHMYYSSHQPVLSTKQPEYYNNGAESDDPLVYSEDESTAAYSRNNGASQLRPLNHRLPYQHSRFNHSQETQQMQEHQRMMALAPNRQVASYVRQIPSTRSSYGSIYVPSNFQHPSSTSPVNEFYMSEDETLMSDTSRSRNSWQRSIRDYRSDMDKIIPEEEEGASESTTLLSPKSSNPVLSSALSVRSNSSHSNSGNRSVPNIPTPSLSNTSGNSSSGSFDVDLIQIRKRVSPPPPLQSVSVDYPNHHRSVSAGTATTVSTSLHSPQKGLLRQNLHTGPPRIFSRKEQKRLMRKLESLEKKEYQIQSIIRSGHGTALDWSAHVPQEISGLNLAAGFFPHEESKAQDVLFAILFLLQMCFVIVLAIVYIGDTVLTGDNATVASPHPSQSLTDDPFSTGSAFVIQNGFGTGKSVASNRSIQVDYSNAFQLSCISALYSASLSALLIGMMMILGKALIPTTLCLTVITCIAFSTIGIALSPYSFVPIIGIIALALSVGYSIVVWDRIPFAATNLDTALCGVKCTADVLVVGMVMMSAAYLWTIIWTVAFLGVYDHYLDDWTDQDSDDFMDWIGILIYGGMFTSYFWTLSVFMNVIHVTVAGVVAQWWSDPGSMTTCCNHVLRENFALSLTSSFGSICLGSFMSPLLRFMKGTFSICCNSYYSNNHSPLTASSSHESVVSNNFSEKGVQCDLPAVAKLPVMTSPFDGMIKYYNDFGFTFVGIYREKFTESSRKATEIFETREWVGVVSDQLIDNVLGLIITAITLGTGCLGLVVEEFDGYSFTNFHKPALTAFMIGCYIGLVVSSVCLKVVTSSVNAVLVCFAVAPWKFQANHPGLSKEMRESWGGIWLDEYEWLSAAEAGLQREDMKI
mmetsp:Transcript_13109/g.24637  ORF Transcript_13109/g.24637 Transcript_13109/m.24637 type:complete len:1112 (+) Transcript_13109:395-3730(+)